VGSSKKIISQIDAFIEKVLARDNRELAPQIGKADLADIKSIDHDLPLCGFNKTEERKSQRALPRASSITMRNRQEKITGRVTFQVFQPRRLLERINQRDV
jgi:hypothetical protein